jgi:hypothetical protein
MDHPWFEQTDWIVLRDARNNENFVRVRGFILALTIQGAR